MEERALGFSIPRTLLRPEREGLATNVVRYLPLSAAAAFRAQTPYVWTTQSFLPTLAPTSYAQAAPGIHAGPPSMG